jgi:hypothetical protein
MVGIQTKFLCESIARERLFDKGHLAHSTIRMKIIFVFILLFPLFKSVSV